MTLPPPPVLLASAILIGWPLVQMISVLLVRKRRARMRALATELRAEADDPSSVAAIKQAVDDSHGDPIFIIFPFVIPLAIIAVSIWELFGRDRPSIGDTKELTSRRAARRAKLDNQSAELEKRRPYLESNGFTISIDPKDSVARSRISKDKRYGDLLNIAFEIGFMRWPVTLIATCLFSAPFLPLYFLAYGLRETAAVIPRLARRFAVTLRLVPQGT